MQTDDGSNHQLEDHKIPVHLAEPHFLESFDSMESFEQPKLRDYSRCDSTVRDMEEPGQPDVFSMDTLASSLPFPVEEDVEEDENEADEATFMEQLTAFKQIDWHHNSPTLLNTRHLQISQLSLTL